LELTVLGRTVMNVPWLLALLGLSGLGGALSFLFHQSNHRSLLPGEFMNWSYKRWCRLLVTHIECLSKPPNAFKGLTSTRTHHDGGKHHRARWLHSPVARRRRSTTAVSDSANPQEARHHTDNPGAYFLEEKLEIFVGGKAIKFETGKIGRSADGAVMVSQGETMIYCTACFTAEQQVSASVYWRYHKTHLLISFVHAQEVDFAPLRVDYFERFSAAGLTSGSYNKRDGKAADHEILVSRLIDRPLRPSLVDGWTCETQVRMLEINPL